MGHQGAWAHGRAKGLVLDLAVNIALPLAIYRGLAARWGDVDALMASCLPPVVWTLGSLLRSRRVDAIALMALAGLGLSLVAMAGGGSARFLQLREQLVTLVIALAFLGSAAIGRPLIGPLARATLARESAEAAARFAARRDHHMVRRTIMVMTLVWGCGLLAEFVAAVALLSTLSISAYLVVSPVLAYGTMGGLGLWTALYRRHRTRVAALAMAAPE